MGAGLFSKMKSLGDRIYLHFQDWLAMAAALVVAALWLVLYHLDLLIQSRENNGALDLRAFDKRRADGRVRAVVDEEHLAKDNRVTFFQIPRELLNSDSVAF